MKPTERSLPEPEWTPAQIAKGLRDATEHKNQVVIVKSAALQIAKWLEFLPADAEDAIRAEIERLKGEA